MKEEVFGCDIQNKVCHLVSTLGKPTAAIPITIIFWSTARKVGGVEKLGVKVSYIYSKI